MPMIGCDLHRRFQQIARREEARGEIEVRRLEHERGAARRIYAPLSAGAGVGIEARGATPWFERLPAEWGQELWVGDPAEIGARMVRQQKTDTGDAEPLLELLLRKHFPGARAVSQAEAVECSGATTTGSLGVGSRSPSAATRTLGAAGAVGTADCGVGGGGRRGSRRATGGGSAATAEGSRCGGGTGLCADAGFGRALPRQPPGGQ